MALTLPLTTTFTPPASCATKTTSFSLFFFGAETSTLLEQARSDAPAECYPPSYAVSATYNPGVCPSGYTTATQTRGSGGTTTAYCCPER